MFEENNKSDQIFARPPSWLLRWGMTLILVAFVFFALIAWLIKYPDEIPARMSILTENPPIRVVSRSSNPIEKLWVSNNQEVGVGAPLVTLRSSAKAENVVKLESFLEKINSSRSQFGTSLSANTFLTIQPPVNLSISDLQSGYASLVSKIKNYQNFLRKQTTGGKINSAEKRIQFLEQLNQNIERQKITLAEEVSLSENGYQRALQLNQSGDASMIEVEDRKAIYLQSKRQLENFENRIINNQIEMERLRTEIFDLQDVQIEGGDDRQLTIEEATKQLQSQLETWKEQFVITAPISGKVSFVNQLSEQQFVSEGAELMTIVPPNASNKVVGKAYLPLANSGKVEVGQTVHIKLDGFPFREYGILKSEVAEISLVPTENHYLVELNLPETLTTSYGKTIPFRQEMQGVAEIITEERRVLERVFDRVRSAVRN